MQMSKSCNLIGRKLVKWFFPALWLATGHRSLPYYSLPCGCLVHHYCLWCISIHHGYASNFTEGNRFSQGFCLLGGRVSKLAGLPAPWVKEVFIVIFSKHMLEKCILKIKIHPMRSSGFHGICRINVMMAAFLATLYSIVKLQAKRKQNACFIIGLQKTS